MASLPAGHPWTVPVTELSVALARAAGIARGGTPVIVQPRPGMPIERVSLYVARCEQPPGTIVRVLHNLEPSTVADMQRQFGYYGHRRAKDAQVPPDIIIVTHAPADGLEHALGRRVQVVETTLAVVGTAMRDEPVRGRLIEPADHLNAQIMAALHRGRGEPVSRQCKEDLDAQIEEALRAPVGMSNAGSGRKKRTRRPSCRLASSAVSDDRENSMRAWRWAVRNSDRPRIAAYPVMTRML